MHEGAATLIDDSDRNPFIPKTVKRRCRLAGTSEGKGSCYSHPREGGRVAVPSQGGDGSCDWVIAFSQPMHLQQPSRSESNINS